MAFWGIDRALETAAEKIGVAWLCARKFIAVAQRPILKEPAAMELLEPRLLLSGTIFRFEHNPWVDSPSSPAAREIEEPEPLSPEELEGAREESFGAWLPEEIENEGPGGGENMMMGGFGELESELTGYRLVAKSVAIDSQGRIVMAGVGNNGSTDRLVVARSLPDGTVDYSFSGDGFFVEDRYGGLMIDADVAIQKGQADAPDKIVVSYVYSGDLGQYAWESSVASAVMRLNDDGTRDLDFGDPDLNSTGWDGLVLLGVGGSYSFNDAFDAEALVIQPNRRIVVAGTGIDSSYLDGPASGPNSLYFVGLEPDGHGYEESTPVGQFDPSFDALILNIESESPYYLTSAVIQPGTEGRVLFTLFNFGSPGFAVGRVAADGGDTLDGDFGSSGGVLIHIDEDEGSLDFSMVVGTDAYGNIVVGGQSNPDPGTYPQDYDFAVARLDPDGDPVTGFGGDGTVRTTITSGQDIVTGIGMDTDGTVMAFGIADFSDNPSDDRDMVTVRYLPNGDPDDEFDTDGIKTDDFDNNNDQAWAMAVTPWGTAAVAGSSADNTTSVFVALEQPFMHAANFLHLDLESITVAATGDGYLPADLENEDYELNLLVNEPEAGTIDRWVVDWGDGSEPEEFDEIDPGTFYDDPVIHSYFGTVSAGQTVTIRVTAYTTDPGPGYTAQPLLVKVREVSGVTDLTAQTSEDEGSGVAMFDVRLSWTNTATNATGIDIYSKIGAGSYSLFGTVGPEATSVVLPGLLPDTAYTFKAVPFNDFDTTDPDTPATAETPEEEDIHQRGYYSFGTFGVVSINSPGGGAPVLGLTGGSFSVLHVYEGDSLADAIANLLMENTVTLSNSTILAPPMTDGLGINFSGGGTTSDPTAVVQISSSTASTTTADRASWKLSIGGYVYTFTLSLNGLIGRSYFNIEDQNTAEYATAIDNQTQKFEVRLVPGDGIPGGSPTEKAFVGPHRLPFTLTGSAVPGVDYELVTDGDSQIEVNGNQGVLTLLIGSVSTVVTVVPKSFSFKDDPKSVTFSLNSTPELDFRQQEPVLPGYSGYEWDSGFEGPAVWTGEIRGVIPSDLDIDSDNTDGVAAPERSVLEEKIEDNPQLPGKVLLANNGDLDNDGVPDFADGIGLVSDNNAPENLHFAPVVVELPADEIDFFSFANSYSLKFIYSSSDPGAVGDEGGIYKPAGGSLRVWLKDGNQNRDAVQDYLGSGQAIGVADTRLVWAPKPDGSGYTTTFYVEAVNATAVPSESLILLSFGKVVESVFEAMGLDTVRVTAVQPTPTYYGDPAAAPGSGSAPGSAGGDPMGLGYSGNVRLSDSSVSVSATDIASNAFGLPWGHTRTWTDALPTTLLSGRYGNGVIVSELPSLLQATSGVIAIGGGQTFRFFDNVGDAEAPSYAARFFTLDQLQFVPDGGGDTTQDQFILTDTLGNQTVFYGFSHNLPARQRGQFKEFIAVNGGVMKAYYDEPTGDLQSVLHYKNPSDAGGDTGAVEGYFYEFAPDQNGRPGLLKNVTWAQSDAVETRVAVRMNYEYYGGTVSASDAFGTTGDLKTAMVFLQEEVAAVDTSYYRYGTVDGLTSDSQDGAKGKLQYVFTPDAVARINGADPVIDFLTASSATISGYASESLTYYNDPSEPTYGRVKTYAFAGIDPTELEYSAPEDGFGVGMNAWNNSTTATMPGGAEVVSYFNFAGELMLSSVTGEGLTFNTYYRYQEGTGRLEMAAMPSAVTGFNDELPDLVDFDDVDPLIEASDGLIYVYAYGDETTAGDDTLGPVDGYLESVGLKNGLGDDLVLQNFYLYKSLTDEGADPDTHVYYVGSSSVYRDSTSSTTDTGRIQTTVTITPDDTYPFLPRLITMVLPTVDSGQNGPDVTPTTYLWLDEYGRRQWFMDTDTSLSFADYDDYDDTPTGSVIQTIVDATDSEELGRDIGLPAAKNLTTARTVDIFGRTLLEISPEGKRTYVFYKDGADVREVRTYSGWDILNHTITDPTQVVREDREHGYTDVVTMTVTPGYTTETTPDPDEYHLTGLEAIDDLVSLSRDYVDLAGRGFESRSYLSPGAYDGDDLLDLDLGTVGTNYLRSTVAYGVSGQAVRSEDTEGFITRGVFNDLLQLVQTWTGTDDAGASETDPDHGDMVLRSKNFYDETAPGPGSGTPGVGDGNLTSTREYFDDPTGDINANNYVSLYGYDWRNRGVQSEGPDHVGMFQTLNNLGLAEKVETFSDLDQDFVFDSGERRGMTETDFDDWMQPYATRVFAVDQSTGTPGIDQETLVWHNVKGESIKQKTPDGLITKTTYLPWGAVDMRVMVTDEGATVSENGFADDVIYSVSKSAYDAFGRLEASLSGISVADIDLHEVAKYFYDDNGDDSGNEQFRLGGTQGLLSVGSETFGPSTRLVYDAAGRQNITVQPDPDGAGDLEETYTLTKYDGLQRATFTQTFKMVSTGPDPEGSDVLLAQSENVYAGSRLYQTKVYSVTAGVASSPLTTTFFYDGQGRTIKTLEPSGMFTKTLYARDGKVLSTYIGTDEGTTVAAAGVEDDIIVEQTDYSYDAAGRVWLTTNFQRFPGDTTTEGALDATSSRGSYTVTWYDEQGRAAKTVNYGAPGSGGAIDDMNDNFDPEPGHHWFFDFESSSAHLKTGYTAVGLTTYPTNDYGWTDTGVSQVDNGSGDDLYRDFHTATADKTFTADLPNGLYRVTMYFKDTANNHTDFNVKAEGEEVLSDVSTTTGGGLVTRTFTVEVTGDALELVFDVDGGTTGGWIINGIDITQPYVDGGPEVNQSMLYMVSTTAYDERGRAFETTDNANHTTRTVYDDQTGRVLMTIANFLSGGTYWDQDGGNDIYTKPKDHDSDVNQITQYVYSLTGQLTRQIALDPEADGNGISFGDDADNQTTWYIYSDQLADAYKGSDVPRNDLLRAILYPGSSLTDPQDVIDILNEEIGAPESHDFVEYTYHADGTRGTVVDQRGVEHSYEYDAWHRLTADVVTNLGGTGAVDDTVLRIDTSYNDRGLVEYVTSYSDTAGPAGSDNVVNQVYTGYDGRGNVVESSQDHHIDESNGYETTNYNRDSLGRLTVVTYAYGNRFVGYDYGAPGSMDDRLSRVASITDNSTTTYASYAYLGVSTIASVTYPDVTDGLMLNYDPDDNNSFAGWDRFGRIIDQKWTDGAGTTVMDRYQYGYDKAGNRVWKLTLTPGASDLDEVYTYDGLDRLVDMERGTISFTGDVADISTPTYTQTFTLDGLGNWDGYDDDGTDHAHGNDLANQITTITGQADPDYDSAGNMVYGPAPGRETAGIHMTYDAWNRLVKVQEDDSSSPGDVIAEYRYDGRGYRIRKFTPGISPGTWDVTEYYYNQDWQVLSEVKDLGIERDGGADPDVALTGIYAEYVWDQRYIDAPVARFRDADWDLGGMEESLFYTNDANFNITVLFDASGAVVEHNVYAPYGGVTMYNDSWVELTTGSAVDNQIGYAGYRYDPETGLFQVRFRYYDTVTGAWTNKDPIEYSAGDDNLYRYVISNPISYTDALGTQPAATQPAASQPAKPLPDAAAEYATLKVNDGVRNGVSGPKITWSVSQSCMVGIVDNGTYKFAPDSQPDKPKVDVIAPGNFTVVVADAINDGRRTVKTHGARPGDINQNTECQYYRIKIAWTQDDRLKKFLNNLGLSAKENFQIIISGGRDIVIGASTKGTPGITAKASGEAAGGIQTQFNFKLDPKKNSGMIEFATFICADGTWGYQRLSFSTLTDDRWQWDGFNTKKFAIYQTRWGQGPYWTTMPGGKEEQSFLEEMRLPAGTLVSPSIPTTQPAQ